MPEDLIDYSDYPRVRQLLFDRTLQATQEAFPISNDRYTLALSDVQYKGPEHYTKADEKEAKLRGKSLTRRLTGRWAVTDNATGQVVSRSKPRTLMNVPYMTSHGTFIRNGVEYTVAKQFRLRPGVYTRITDDGRTESQFNAQPRTGTSFRVFMEPDSSIFYMKHGGNKVPLYPVLRAMGVNEDVLRERWGKKILEANRAMEHKPHAIAWINKFAPAPKDKEALELSEERRNNLIEHFNKTRLDPTITQMTLGKPHDHASVDAILDSTSKIIRVARREQDIDDRDSLLFQTIHDVSDFLGDKVKNDQNAHARKILWKVTGKNGDTEKIPPSFMDKHVQHLFDKAGLAQAIEQINPLDPFDQNQRVLRMGEGALPSIDVVPKEARNVQASYLGYVDHVRAPESLRIGVDMRLARNVRKGPGNILYTQFVSADGKPQWVDQRTAAQSVIGFAASREDKRRYVPAMIKGRLGYVDKSKIDFYVEDGDDEFSYGANLVPFKSGDKSMRLLMGSKYGPAALPLVRRESPLVRTADPRHGSTEEYVGKFLGAIRADKPGRVAGVYKDHIKVQNDDGTTAQYDMYVNSPFARKTFIRNMPLVKAGTRIKPGQVLASSNYTDDEGLAALGTNLKVAYATYHGKNYEDAIIVSESAAKKLTSEHMYKEALEKDEGLAVDKKKFFRLFPGRFNKEQLDSIDPDTGIAKPGTQLKYGDPIVLAVREREPSQATMGRRLRSDASIVWKHHFPASITSVVTDVVEGKKNYAAYVRANVPLEVGDKLASRHGNKGVIAEVVPDEQMMKDKDGNPFDIILAPEGLISRTNSAQLIETLLGKVAAKTGIPYTIPGFSKESGLEMVQNELRKHRLKAEEEIYDPVLNKKIPEVFTGNQYFYKLQQTAESKAKSRSTGKYTSEGEPAKGSGSGAKHFGDMEYNALLAYGANAVIKDLKIIKGQSNDNFWRQLKLGHTPSMPGIPLVYQKFRDLVRAAGVDLRDEAGDHDNIFAMSNKRVQELTGDRRIETTATYKADDMTPMPGGLFDPKATGADNKGDRWSYIQLPEPMLNPVMYDPVRVLLDLKRKELDAILAGKTRVNGKYGGDALKSMLASVDLGSVKKRATDTIKHGAKSKRDNAIKQYQYAAALEKQKLRPEDFLWDRVPVLPPRFRPIFKLGKQTIVSDPNYMYKAMLESIEDFQETQKEQLPLEQQERAREVMNKTLQAVVGIGDPVQGELQSKRVGGILSQLLGKGSPKSSFVQRRVIGSNADMTGMSVIVPNPSLKLNEVGLPEERAWELYQPFIVRHMVRKGVPATVAAKSVHNKDKAAYAALQAVVKERPVLINRAPTLHKYSILAAWPRLTKGHTLQIPPAITGPISGDFDGDQQISTLIVLLNDAILSPTLKKEVVEMAVKFRSSVPICDGLELYALDLENFPRIENTKKFKMGEKGPIDLYEVPEGILVLSYQDGRLQWAAPSHFSVHADREVEIVELSNKYQIITDDDPRAVMGIGIESLQMQRFTPTAAVAQRVLVPRAQHVPVIAESAAVFEFAELNETAGVAGRLLKDVVDVGADVAYMVGAFLGDGWVSRSSGGMQICVCGEDQDVLQGFEDGLMKFFTEDDKPKRTTYDFSKEEHPDRHGNVTRWTWSNTLLGEFLLSLCGHSSRGKRIPGKLFNFPRDCRMALFGGLMDTDGSISVSNAKKKPQLIGGYTSINLGLIRDVALLARSLDIRCRITPFTYRGNPAWQLAFSTVDLAKWAGEGMRCQRKLDKFKGVEANENATAAVRKDLVPFPKDVQDIVCAAVSPRSGSIYTTVRKGTKTNYLSRFSAVQALDEAKKCLKSGPCAVLQQWEKVISDKAVTWERVLEVVKTGQKETGYDLTVPGTESFANFDGVILSNTMSYSVPVSAEAVDEAKAKMLPERILLSERFDQAQFVPGNEYVKGLYLATKPPTRKPVKRFSSRAEAYKAYRNGEIAVDDPIIIE